MFWLKSCPRCHGDLYDNADIYGDYIDCLQCGHYLTSAEDTELRSRSPRGKTYTFSPSEPVRVLAEMIA